jgi:hypothetical protein
MIFWVRPIKYMLLWSRCRETAPPTVGPSHEVAGNFSWNLPAHRDLVCKSRVARCSPVSSQSPIHSEEFHQTALDAFAGPTDGREPMGLLIKALLITRGHIFIVVEKQESGRIEGREMTVGGHLLKRAGKTKENARRASETPTRRCK